VIIEKPVQSLPHGREIIAAIGSEPPAPYQHVDFRLAQLDRDASQPFPPSLAMASHTRGAR
jgi:hypothetical protein